MITVIILPRTCTDIELVFPT